MMDEVAKLNTAKLGDPPMTNISRPMSSSLRHSVLHAGIPVDVLRPSGYKHYTLYLPSVAYQPKFSTLCLRMSVSDATH